MSNHHTILLVEDEVESGEMLANFLEMDGFEVLWAKDGKEAYKLIESRAEDLHLALLDIMVPHHDGKDICRKIREHPVIFEIPVIFLTAKTDDTAIERGFSLGGVDYITKPFNTNEFVARLKAILRAYH